MRRLTETVSSEAIELIIFPRISCLMVSFAYVYIPNIIEEIQIPFQQQNKYGGVNAGLLGVLFKYTVSPF